jgi:hypothetical protein
VTPIASHIYKEVLAAMQSAEEIGGPEGADYRELMAKIAQEATARREANLRTFSLAGPLPELVNEEDDDLCGDCRKLLCSCGQCHEEMCFLAAPCYDAPESK